jgi:hypothetical protein
VMYNLDTGKPETRGGRPAPRPVGVAPPCRRCPKGGPDNFADFLPQNSEAVRHYMECSATRHFPRDAIVARHASLLKQVEQEVERMKRREEMGLMMVKQSVAQMGAMVGRADQSGSHRSSGRSGMLGI